MTSLNCWSAKGRSVKADAARKRAGSATLSQEIGGTP